MRIIEAILGRVFGKQSTLPCGCTPEEHKELSPAEMGARALFFKAFQDEVYERLRARIKLKYGNDIDRICADVMLKHADIKFFVDEEEKARAKAANMAP